MASYAPFCKGKKPDGSPCKNRTYNHNGYCNSHQGQHVPQQPVEEPVQQNGSEIQTDSIPEDKNNDDKYIAAAATGAVAAAVCCVIQ